MTNSNSPAKQQFLNRLPVVSADIMGRLLRLPLINQPDQLLLRLDDAQSRFKIALEQNEFLDIQSAMQMKKVLQELLEAWDGLAAEHRSIVAGATLYFIKNDDAESDTDSIFGLEDDLEVVNVMLDVIGRSDLHIDG